MATAVKTELTLPVLRFTFAFSLKEFIECLVKNEWFEAVHMYCL